MIDVADAARATTDWWDTSTESQMTQWGTFQRWETIGDGNRPETYRDFWTDRQIEGNDVSDERSRSSAFQNTIDYSFRNPLAPSVEETWPSPQSTRHGFRFGNSPTLNGGGWTAVATRGDGNVDLSLYNDLEQTDLLARSAASGALIDVVAVDQRHRNARTGYPVVERVTGGGAYTIEWAEAKRAIVDGVATIPLGAADVVQVRDTAHRTGLPVFYRVVPTVSQDITVLLMDSSPTNSASWVRSRGQAVRTANTSASGVGESFSYSTTTDTLGLVVLNKSGGGTVSVYRDTTAPTASIAINSGAADTSDRKMAVRLSAKDAQTGIWQMRLSVDGTFDTEPWTAYKTTAQVIFARGDGPKTVRVQVSNQANMTVTTADTIRLYTGPRCDELIPTIRGTTSHDTITGTEGDDIIVGLRRDDVIDGLGGNDIICGGAGRDTLIGGAGNDRLYGGPGDDSLEGWSGNDLLFGEGGGDELTGGAGHDVCNGGTGFDTILLGCEERREIP
jgi:Ca2+-binding RTX toxin-like protein